MSESKQVKITVATLSDSHTDTFDIDQKLQDVRDKAFLSLDIKVAPGEDWQLWYNDTDLNLQRTIEEYKIPDGATLLLAPKEAGGGC